MFNQGYQWENVIHMHDLQIWQRDINKYDQIMRKMLAIRELGDLPFEIWQDLLSSSPSQEFQITSKTFGTGNYSHDVKLWCLKYAMSFYTKKYMEFHKLEDLEEARKIINNVLELEVPVKDIWFAAKIKTTLENKAAYKPLPTYNNIYPVNGHELQHNGIPFPSNGYGY